MGATSHLLITQFSHLIKSTALNSFSPLSQTSACSSRTSSTWGGEVPVSPRVSVASPALHHCCLPEERPSHYLHNPRAAGDVRPGLPPQAIFFCTHIIAVGQGQPSGWRGCSQLGKHPSALALFHNLLPTHLLLTTARHRGTQTLCSEPALLTL